MTVKLEYSIEDYRSGEKYFVALLCASESPDGWLETTIPYRKRVKKAKGKIKVLYSLQDLLADNRLARPLRMKFLLQRSTGVLLGEVLAETPEIEYAAE